MINITTQKHNLNYGIMYALQKLYAQELDRLYNIGINPLDILSIYQQSTEKFQAIINHNILSFIENITLVDDQLDPIKTFADLCHIYDTDKKMFWDLANDQEEINASTEEDSEKIEEYNYYNGLDYEYSGQYQESWP